MNANPVQVKENLCGLIHDMAKTPWLFVKDPKRDFTRDRKLTFEKMLSLLVGMGGGSLAKEMLEGFGYAPETASSSAFIQQRGKILPEALEFLFHAFTGSYTEKRLCQGYRLLAVDGSDLQIAADPSDTQSYLPGSEQQKAYNLLHLNALYDLGSHLYVDALVQKKRESNEHAALTRMVERSDSSDPVILLADRGYESYNSLAHIERKGWNYVIRIKDSANGGIYSGLALPEQPEFDMEVRLILTRKQTNRMKACFRENPGKYRLIAANQTFDFLDLHDQLTYPIAFRVVRFQIAPDSYETVITNLPADPFPPLSLKLLYNMRWGIETAFRALKYTVGLLHFHAKKAEFIVQEIFAKLTMHNFTQMITSHAAICDNDRTYAYQANFSAAMHICCQFFRNAVSPPSVETLISQFISPIRPGRSAPRAANRKTFIGSTYFYRIN